MLALEQSKTSLTEAGRQALEPLNANSNKPDSYQKPKPEFAPFDEKSIVLKSQFELKEGYMQLRKEFLHSRTTVQALQRNFETLSKLAIADQEEKGKLLVQN